MAAWGAEGFAAGFGVPGAFAPRKGSCSHLVPIGTTALSVPGATAAWRGAQQSRERSPLIIYSF